jgi:hypothetical protein
MAQHDYNIANQGFSSFRSDLNNALSAIQTTNSGTSLPTGAVAGQIWLDTTNSTNPTLKFYDGSDSISLATINYTANTVDWLDSSVTITGLSTSATGTVLTLSDTANTTSVNLIIDNQKEVRFRETTANGTNYIGLKAPASLSADLTFTLPSVDGTSGQALVTDGAGGLSFTTISAGTSWQSVQTTGFTAVSGRGYPCNTTSAGFTVTLPASPSAGNYIQIVDYAGTFNTNNLTLGANSNKINGAVANKILTTNREAVTITYVDSTQGWVASSGANEGTQSLDPVAYSVDFLVVAGGGGGGSDAEPSTPGAGGGGAGGYRTSTQTVSPSTVITVTVGDGGNGGVAGSSGTKTSGSNSSISGSGLTTITSAGGGYGGSYNIYAPVSGGSGGGGAYTGGGGGSSGASGNTPSTSPSQGNNGGDGNNSNQGGGGGGGSGAVGGTPSVSTAGVGGIGSSSSITGSSVYYAGGGGGGGGNPAVDNGGAGGNGGGGAGGGQNTSANGVAGTVNTGGGGGGGAGGGSGGTINGNGGNGGKGVVILSVPTGSYSGISTGSPTITTSGSNTILKFTGTGSYTT